MYRVHSVFLKFLNFLAEHLRFTDFISEGLKVEYSDAS